LCVSALIHWPCRTSVTSILSYHEEALCADLNDGKEISAVTYR
jgi:hypothetical protein